MHAAGKCRQKPKLTQLLLIFLHRMSCKQKSVCLIFLNYKLNVNIASPYIMPWLAGHRKRGGARFMDIRQNLKIASHVCESGSD